MSSSSEMFESNPEKFRNKKLSHHRKTVQLVPIETEQDLFAGIP
jgi:hypothetical protein